MHITRQYMYHNATINQERALGSLGCRLQTYLKNYALDYTEAKTLTGNGTSFLPNEASRYFCILSFV